MKASGEDDPGFKDLTLAFTAVKEIANHINEAQRKMEGSAKLAQIQAKIVDFVREAFSLFLLISTNCWIDKHKNTIVEPHRVYIREGKLEMETESGGIESFYCFLFSDILVYTTPRLGDSKSLVISTESDNLKVSL